MPDRPTLAHLRHELRTPLNHIIGYGEMLLEDLGAGAHAGLAPHLQRILDDARCLLEGVNEFLSSPSVEAGTVDIAQLPPALATHLDGIINTAATLGSLAGKAGADDLLPDVRRICNAGERLRDLIRGDVTLRPTPHAAPLPASVSAGSPSHGGTDRSAILVVDDNAENREMLSRRLAREGHANVAAAADGREALELLGRQRFDLVLLDVMMPEVNGYQVLETLKADPKRRDIPVIMISALDEMESTIRCIEMGAEDYLPKPFNPTLLRARVGASLEKKRLRDEVMRHVTRMEHELETARAIQLSMVPTDFPVASRERPLEVYATLQPAYEVGGDLYDFFWVAPGRLCLIVADVSNKGAPAALFMARAKAVLRLVAAELAAGAEAELFAANLVARANEELCQDNPHAMFATLVLCVVDARTGAVSYCTAGHDPPYIVAPGGNVTRLAVGSNLPAGIEPEFTREVQEAQLPAGSSLFAYTDGVTEAMNARREMFGATRLEAALAAHAGRAPQDIIAGVLREVRAFTGDVDTSDDIAALACRWGL